MYKRQVKGRPLKTAFSERGTGPPKPTSGVSEERVRNPQTRMRKIPPSSTEVRLLDQLRSCFVAGPGIRDRKSAFPLALTMWYSRRWSKQGEKLEPPLSTRIVISHFADAFERLCDPKICEASCPKGSLGGVRWPRQCCQLQRRAEFSRNRGQRG